MPFPRGKRAVVNAYLLPVLLLTLLLAAALKKVPVYRAFCKGAGDAIPLATGLFPFLCAVMVMSELMRLSGVSRYLSELLSPALSLLGIPKELSPLLLMKPFSGSASLTMLADVCKAYGTESVIARCAAVVYGSSETVFYVTAVYFSGTGKRKFLFPVAVSLTISVLSAALGCALIRLGL